MVNFFDPPEVGRKRRATVISQGPLQKGGTKGHFLSICPLRRRAVRLCQCHGPFVADRQPEVIPCPSPALAADAHALLHACFLSHTGGRGD